MRGAAHRAQLVGSRPDRDAALVDDHQVILIGHAQDGHKVAGLLGDAQGFDPLSTAVGDPVILDRGTLSIAALADHEHILGTIHDDDHADDLVIGSGKGHPLHPLGRPTHSAHLFLGETDGFAGTESHEDLVLTGGELRLKQLVAFADGDGVDAVGPRA